MSNIIEIWKDIPNYEGIYQVSNIGNVKSLSRLSNGRVLKEKILKFYIAHKRGGYKIVGLHKNNKMKHIPIHRLVALTFIPNPENKPQIDHINGIRTENTIENLRWVTPKENANNPLTLINNSLSKQGKVRPDFVKEKIRKTINSSEYQEKVCKKVRCVETGIVYKSITIAAQQTKLTISGITDVCRGRLKTYKGRHWEYVK